MSMCHSMIGDGEDRRGVQWWAPGYGGENLVDRVVHKVVCKDDVVEEAPGNSGRPKQQNSQRVGGNKGGTGHGGGGEGGNTG